MTEFFDQGAQIELRSGAARFASIADLVSTERARAWTLGGLLGDAQFETHLTEADRALAPFVKKDGSVAFDMPALFPSWRGPRRVNSSAPVSTKKAEATSQLLLR